MKPFFTASGEQDINCRQNQSDRDMAIITPPKTSTPANLAQLLFIIFHYLLLLVLLLSSLEAYSFFSGLTPTLPALSLLVSVSPQVVNLFCKNLISFLIPLSPNKQQIKSDETIGNDYHKSI